MIIRQEEFSDCIKEYEKIVITVCLSFTKNYFDAEDLAQDTFLTAYRSLNTFDGGNLKAWLITIAANKCRDFLKSPKRKTGLLSPEDILYLEDNRENPAERLEEKATDEKVYSLCQKLKEPYQSVATDYFCKGVGLSEQSLASGQNLRTLQTRLYRAKKLLKALWKEESA